MMSIQLKKPYKIIHHKQKRYEDHYHIPSGKCIVVPVKQYGDDFSCNVHWEDTEGKHQQLNDLFFSQQNLETLDAMNDYQLNELWQQQYQPA